jgi:hypothetical protein
MAEQGTPQAPRQTSEGKGKGGSKSGPKRGPGLAPIAGEKQADDRPAERQPGTSEHLGSDRPYEGDDSPYVEGDPDARNR